MIDLKEKLNNLSDNRKRILLIAVCVISLMLLVVSEFSSEEGDKIEAVTHASAQEYIDETEKQLEDILSQVQGAGKVHVMITLESCYENVYAGSYSSESKNSGDDSSIDVNEDLVIVKNSDGENGVIVKVYEPVVKGVAVVCEGADSVKVRSSITETVCALFNVSSAKVSVIKGYKE